jgi:uncharacterized protein (TIGR02996 family)
MSGDHAIPKSEPNPALYKAVLAAPDDDAQRLAYADWFEANGDADRARFIRLQCQAEHLPHYHSEYSRIKHDADRLRYQHWTAWLQGRPRFHDEVYWEFLRGFPEAVTFDSFKVAEARGDKVFRHYVRRLSFHNLRSVRKLAEWPLLARVRELDLGPTEIVGDDLRRLAESPHVRRLARLRFRGGRLHPAGVEALASAELPQLRHLAVESCSPTDAPRLAAALARGPLLRRLHHLDLDSSHIGDAGLRALAEASAEAELTDLLLVENSLTADGVEAAVDYRAWPRLRQLYLGRNRLGDAGAEQVARARHWSSLRALSLYSCGVGNVGAAALAGASHLSGLQELQLTSNAVGNAGAEALAASPHLGALISLDLPRNLVGEAGGWALARSTRLPALRRINLNNNALRPELLQAIMVAVNSGDPSALDALESAPPEVAEPTPVAPLPAGQTTVDEAGLLQAIADDPDDDLPALAYADWVEENGDPQKAELIRLRLASFDTGYSHHEHQVLAANIGRWLGPLRPHVVGGVGGFYRATFFVTVSMATFMLKAFQADAVRLFEQAKVTGLTLDGRTTRWDKVAASPLLASLRELRLPRTQMNGAALDTLLGSPNLAHLHTLDLGYNSLDGNGLGRVAKATTLPRLRRLFMPSCRYIGTEQMAAFLAWPQAGRLTTLDLSENWLSAAQAAQLADSPRMAGLRVLNLSHNYLRSAGVVALASSPTFANLRRLHLRDCHFDIEGALDLASSPHLRGLTFLEVSTNSIGERGARALAESPNLAGCRIDLRWCGLSDEAARELAQRFGDRLLLR